MALLQRRLEYQSRGCAGWPPWGGRKICQTASEKSRDSAARIQSPNDSKGSLSTTIEICRGLIGPDLQISFFAALRSACSKASTKGSSSSSLMPIFCLAVRQLSTECETSLNISLARAFVMRK